MKNSCATRVFCQLALFLAVCGVAGSPTQLYSQQTTATSTVSVPEQDPNKADSEFNHHMAGYALIAIGALVLAGNSSAKLRPLQLFWPFLFIAAGVFLAAWSDAEIWPRGNLSWRFLIHHDFEARQHKFYAILLIAIGIVEFLRARGKLSRFWRISAFPLLAVLGAVLLLFHDHTGTSGASTPEARQYLVSGAVSPSNEASPDPMPGMHNHESKVDSSMVADQSGPSTSMEHGHDMPGMDMSGHDMSEHDMAEHDASHPGIHPHQMSPAMLKVEHEHFWFMVVGLAIALFKFLSDGTLWRRSLTLRLWPGLVALLGVMLVFYTE